ncbi:energy transducer TonB [Chryseobacterium oryctis]|uniref:TonB protein C-terminal n=1 Tax=Chryseobacterium oryctis TaxID=2952618 RepID=A0ABT3HLJ1_9FLAO|nr:hypothetical protein [Chryseobacterium oryctis]MCW3160634.1 hypothetical protein [Chryseobacterium oryctis]
MKKAILFLMLSFGFMTFAQKSETYTPEFSSVTNVPNYGIIKAKMKLDDVVTKADTAPEFPGGTETFKRQFAEKMDVIDVKSNKINTRVYFIVEKNGYVRYVTATGDDKKHSQAAEIAVRRMFVRWKPATINGEPVRYLYTFPLTLKKY